MKTNRGFSLIEVTLALGVAGFCLVTIMGLIPLGLNSNQNSLEQTMAASLASQVYSDLRVAAKTSNATSPRFNIPIASGTTMQFTSDGQVVAAGASQPANPARFKVNISFANPPAPQGSGSTLPPGQSTQVHILVTWPPVPAAQNAAGAFEAVDALDRG